MEGGRGGQRAESCDHKKAWTSVSHSILSAMQGQRHGRSFPGLPGALPHPPLSGNSLSFLPHHFYSFPRNLSEIVNSSANNTAAQNRHSVKKGQRFSCEKFFGSVTSRLGTGKSLNILQCNVPIPHIFSQK